jgi:hypothetical protein
MKETLETILGETPSFELDSAFGTLNGYSSLTSLKNLAPIDLLEMGWAIHSVTYDPISTSWKWIFTRYA